MRRISVRMAAVGEWGGAEGGVLESCAALWFLVRFRASSAIRSVWLSKAERRLGERLLSMSERHIQRCCTSLQWNMLYKKGVQLKTLT